MKWGVELSPRIIIRMYNERSHPVRTPSFMPRVTFFYQFIDKENGKRDLFAYLSWIHHSNGQEGYFYNTDSTTINTLAGSFSTNWIEGGVFLSRPNTRLLFNTNYIKLNVEYNYKQDKELDNIHGRLKYSVNIKSTVRLFKVFRIIVAPQENSKKYVYQQSIKLGWIAGSLNDTKTIDAKRFIFNYTLSFKPKFLKDVNFFIQYYYGQDYYNIHFSRQLSVVRFGISSKSSMLF